MKKIIFLLIGLATIFSGDCFAQQKTANQKIQFHSFNSVGLIEGEAGSAFQPQTINGFQYKSWFYGIGVGLDYYRLRTIPLFADMRKEFGKNGNKFFVYADAGMNFYWKEDKDAKQFYINDKFKNGFYGEAGFGYKFRLDSKTGVFISGGYSYKKLTETGSNGYFDPGWPITGINGYDYPPERINYNLNRLVLKAGIEF
jgi:hypothetical protein